MSSSSTTLILLGVGLAVLLGLLLLGPAEEDRSDVSLAQSAVVSSVGTESALRAIGVPSVEAGPNRVVGERETVTLRGDVSVPSGEAVTYRWTAEGGLGFFENAHSLTTSYSAPSACDCEAAVALTLTATTASGVRASDSLIVSVRDPLACPIETYEVGGSYVTVIDRCRTVGAEAACPARPSEPCASACITDAPPSGDCPQEPVRCPCSTSGCDGGWTTSWPLDPRPEHPRDRPKPRIDRQYPEAIDEGAAVPIVGYVSNPACVSVCFSWSASKGWLEGADTLHPVYHAPQSERRDGESATIMLTVYDSSGGRSYDQIRMHIVNTDPR